MEGFISLYFKLQWITSCIWSSTYLGCFISPFTFQKFIYKKQNAWECNLHHKTCQIVHFDTKTNTLTSLILQTALWYNLIFYEFSNCEQTYRTPCKLYSSNGLKFFHLVIAFINMSRVLFIINKIICWTINCRVSVKLHAHFTLNLSRTENITNLIYRDNILLLTNTTVV